MPLTSLLLRSRRCLLLACLSAFALAACSQQIDSKSNQGKKMTAKNDVVYFDVSAISYIERPIFEVKLNGIEIGAGGGGLMTGVAVPLGPQVITWRLGGPEGMPGNGDTVKAINQPVLSRPDSKTHYLGVHIYPDNTVEVIPERFWPTNSEKGDAFLRAWEKKHGK